MHGHWSIPDSLYLRYYSHSMGLYQQTEHISYAECMVFFILSYDITITCGSDITGD